MDLRTPEEEPVELTHRALVPDWALVDASFAGTLSNDLRCDGAAETLAQASEAYLSAWANPFSDALALSALRTVVERLPHAVRWSDDPDAREELHYAATLAGLAASNAQRGVAHALARALVAVTDLSYARLVGVLLPYVLEFDQPSARDRLEVASGVMRRPDDATSLPASVRLRRFYESVRFPTDLKSAGVPPERLAGAESTVVARALRSPGVLANPRVPSAADLGALLTSAMLGTSVR